jgi:hypothetical protein
MDELEIRLGDLIIRLFSGVETASKRTALTIEDYIIQQRQMGVSDEVILQNLNDDLRTDRFGFFKSYKGELRDTVTGGLHQASSLGQFTQYAKRGMQKMFRWVAVGDEHSCRDCEDRQGQVEDLETWELIGLPASGFSVCNERCRCILEPETIEEHGRIDLGIK